MSWVDEMQSENKTLLLLSARKGGRELRKEHMKSEKEVLKQISENMLEQKSVKCQKRTCKSDQKNDPSGKRHKFEVGSFVLNEYVAIAYQDDWYPGCIAKVIDNDTAIVKFMTPCQKAGYFQWPSRDDKQTVKTQFVLKRNVVPDCVGSGRQYCVKEHNEIEKLYRQFHTTYFE